MPFSLKAGTVGQLELKMSLMSMFSSDAGQLEIHLENVFFIVGPSMRTVSNDDSYLKETEQELLEHYDENNAFNIFSNNLKLRKKTGTQSPDKLPAAEETKTEATDGKLACALTLLVGCVSQRRGGFVQGAEGQHQGSHTRYQTTSPALRR